MIPLIDNAIKPIQCPTFPLDSLKQNKVIVHSRDNAISPMKCLTSRRDNLKQNKIVIHPRDKLFKEYFTNLIEK